MPFLKKLILYPRPTFPEHLSPCFPPKTIPTLTPIIALNRLQRVFQRNPPLSLYCPSSQFVVLPIRSSRTHRRGSNSRTGRRGRPPSSGIHPRIPFLTTPSE